MQCCSLLRGWNNLALLPFTCPSKTLHPFPLVCLKKAFRLYENIRGKIIEFWSLVARGLTDQAHFAQPRCKEEEGLSLLDAFKEVKRKHPEAMPHQPLWESLCAYYNETIPYFDVMLVRV